MCIIFAHFIKSGGFFAHEAEVHMLIVGTVVVALWFVVVVFVCGVIVGAMKG